MEDQAGEVCYSQIAKDVKDLRAVRAVGRANGQNPLAIAIPCHRVVRADGMPYAIRHLAAAEHGPVRAKVLGGFKTTHYPRERELDGIGRGR